MFIVSIGTGSQDKAYQYKKAKKWGDIGWVKPVIDIMMSGAAEVTNYNMLKMFSANGNGNNYVRIQPANLGKASPDMDCTTQQNIEALIEVGRNTANNCTDIDRIIDLLINDRNDSVQF